MKKIISFIIAFVFSLLPIRCEPAQFFPEEGIWYCSELGIQLDFDDGLNCFFIYQGVKIVCDCEHDRGSSYLSVICQDMNTKHFTLGEEVFGAEFVSLDTERLILLEEETQTAYIFLRME